MNNFLRDAVIFDTETTSLRRGSGIHEASVYSFADNKVTEYILNPNKVDVTPAISQDISNLAVSAQDIHTRVFAKTWREIIEKEVFEAAGMAGQGQSFLDVLKWRNNFLYKALIDSKAYPQLEGKVEDTLTTDIRTKRFLAAGVQSVSLKQSADMNTSFMGNLATLMKSKTVWIANAGFEAKQVGAQLAAGMPGANPDYDFKKILNLETRSKTNVDPFYVTGVEVNRARVKAQMTGDWQEVWRAYKKYTPKKGETAVRDIQDVVRAVMSYGRDFDLFKGGSSYFGTGIDVTSRLFAEAEGNDFMKALPELHKSAEDAAIHEKYVLQKSVQYAEALEELFQGSDKAYALIDEAKQGKGVLSEINKYFALLERNAKQINTINLRKRLLRAYEDIETSGRTVQVSGTKGFVNMPQQSPQGKVSVPRTSYAYSNFSTFDEFGEFLRKKNDYGDFGIDVDHELTMFKQNATSLRSVTEYVDGTRLNLNTQIPLAAVLQKNNTPVGIGSQYKSIANKITQGMSNGLSSLGRKNSKQIGILGAAFAGISLLNATINEEPEQKTKSVLGFGYNEWLATQEGMAHQGMAKANRSLNTDFGSPYQGPFISNEVLQNQKLLEEREKWLREQYNARHYDPYEGVISSLGKFKHKWGSSYARGDKVSHGYKGLKGDDLASIKLNDNWNVEVEDADTVSISKKGMLNQALGVLGLGENYSFRLAGIDAPETAHGDKEAQPYAEKAKKILQERLATDATKEIVLQRGNNTYGRSMAALVVDNKNINYELVEKGSAAYLGFGSNQDSLVDYKELQKIESRAFEAKRGMWGNEWGQNFFNISKGTGQRITFNTLNNPSKVVSNTSLMNLTAALDRKNANPQEMINIGKQYNFKSDYVRPSTFEAVNSPNSFYESVQLSEAAQMTKTKGDRINRNRQKRTGKLYKNQTLDTMDTNTSVYSRRKYAIYKQYERKNKQAQAQRDTLNGMFMSPINHSRML